jgi:hypothetical protein
MSTFRLLQNERMPVRASRRTLRTDGRPLLALLGPREDAERRSAPQGIRNCRASSESDPRTDEVAQQVQAVEGVPTDAKARARTSRHRSMRRWVL